MKKAKRGRPRKDKSKDNNKKKDVVDSVSESAKNWEKGAKKSLATHVPPTETTNTSVNTIYHYKDGGTCAVYYSWCKDKPIDIKQS